MSSGKHNTFLLSKRKVNESIFDMCISEIFIPLKSTSLQVASGYKMEFILFLTFVIIIINVIERKLSIRAAWFATAVLWIGGAFLVAVSLNTAIKESEIDKMQYRQVFGFTYLMAFIGCGYLLPAMLGVGKKKPKKKIEL